MLNASPDALTDHYDLAMLDLDGVVYIGGEAVPGAADHLAAVRAAGMRCAFITNNAARTPDTVAAHLTDLGIEAAAADVVTSAQAAARVLRDRLGEGAHVAVLGGAGLLAAVTAEHLVPAGLDDEAEAVVSGYGPDVRWSDVMRAAVRIRDGLWWVASNTDASIPTPFGVAPGHGVLVDTLRRFSAVEPVVAGKPARPLLDETIRRVGGERPLMIGDRLDTDIEGARAAGIDSLLVLTGVSGLAEVVAARPEERPTYVGVDLGALRASHAAPQERDGSWHAGGWRGSTDGGRLEVSGEGSVDDWWRCVAAAAWSYLDTSGAVADVSALRVPTDGVRPVTSDA
ncbi:HAD-IIA family hydrolase [Nocardioides sp.]|uniref:HAD-IIA family hydrolase n=1 Tax=Nocardioides sp. TaxID=35761 RepID=UPI002B26A866|nr:HAD-IIA family hydrolase [Nocardioides sp.]